MRRIFHSGGEKQLRRRKSQSVHVAGDPVCRAITSGVWEKPQQRYRSSTMAAETAGGKRSWAS